MAVQINLDELKGCPSYLDWILGNICCQSVSLSGEDDDYINRGSCNSDLGKESGSCSAGKAIVDICRVMFDTDFIWDEKIKEDEIRATDAMELRRRYADEIGANLAKNEHDIDRIWKSVHGKCSVLEVLVSICFRLDEMLNENEPGEMVGMFFDILCGNLGFVFSEAFDEAKTVQIIERFLKREYAEDGSGGGLFPVVLPIGNKNQKVLPIWYQMNAWLAEHMDEDEHFVR